MPPKSKKGNKGKEKKKLLIPLDDIDTSELTKDKLIEFCVRVNEELNDERQHCDFLRLDRDKLINMEKISNQQLVELKTGNRQLELDMGDAEEAHRKEMADNRQKLIYLAIEKNVDELNKKLESDRLTHEENAKHQERVEHLVDDIKELKDQFLEMENAFQNNKLKLQREQAEEKSKLRDKDKEVSILKENVRDKNWSDTIRELNKKFSKEYESLEKRKNKEINDFLLYNVKFVNDLNHYYNKILHHNVKVISELKASCQAMKANTAIIETELSGLKVQTAELNDELNKLKANERMLQKQLTSSKRDQHQLKNIKIELERGIFDLDHMRWELETLKISQEKQEDWMKKDRDIAEMEEFDKLKSEAESLLAWEYIVIHLHYKHKEIDSTLRKIRDIYHSNHLHWPSELDNLIGQKEDTVVDEANYQLTASLDRRNQLIGVVRSCLRRRGMNEADIGFAPQSEADLLRIEALRVLVDEGM